MSPEQKAAYVMAQSACAIAQVARMQAVNQALIAGGDAPAYGAAEFDGIFERYVIEHNAVITFFAQ